MAQLFEADFQGSGSTLTTGPTKREDLADWISLIDAKDTPLTSMMPKGKDLGNMYHRWSADEYEATTIAGYKDGKDAVDTADSSLGNAVSHGAVYAPYIQSHARNREELSNYAQYFRRATKVSPLASEVTNPVGGKNLLAQGIAKKTVELKRDMEASFLSDNTPIKETSSVPYQTRALGQWVTETVTAGGADIPADFKTPGASTIDVGSATATDSGFSEAAVQGVLESIYGETGSSRTYDLICGTKIKRAFTNLTSTEVTDGGSTNGWAATKVRTFNQELGNTTFKNTITVFEGDFGTLNIHVDNFVPEVTRGYIIPMEMTELRYGMLPRVQSIPNSGSGEGRIVEAVASLVVKNPKGFGKFSSTAA